MTCMIYEGYHHFYKRYILDKLDFRGFWVHGIRSCTIASNGICTSILLFFAVYVILAWTARVADRSVHSSVQIYTVDFGFLMGGSAREIEKGEGAGRGRGMHSITARSIGSALDKE